MTDILIEKIRGYLWDRFGQYQGGVAEGNLGIHFNISGAPEDIYAIIEAANIRHTELFFEIEEMENKIKSSEILDNCPVCAGSGRDTESEPDPIQAGDCMACRGTGKL